MDENIERSIIKRVTIQERGSASCQVTSIVEFNDEQTVRKILGPWRYRPSAIEILKICRISVSG